MAKKVLLKDVATLLNGRAYKQDELLGSGKYPVLRVGNFFSNRGWFFSDLELEEDKYCDNGDLLFAWSASFGPKIWDGGKVIYHYHIWKILTTSQIDKKYFYYYLENAADRIKESGHGIAMIHTTKGEMEQMELLLPEMQQQLQIASVLDKISELIGLRKEQLAKLDELVKARFVELFGSLNGNEKGLDISSIEELCTLIKDGTHQTPTYTEDKEYGFKFLSSKDVMTQKICWDEIKYIPAELHEKLYATIQPMRNDILMSKNGVNYGVAAVNDTDEVFDIYVSLALLRPRTDRVNPVYLRCAINNPYTKRQFDSSIKGIGVPNLHLGEIKKTKVLVPPMSKQNEFVAFVEQTDKSKLAIQQSLDKLETLKKSLMQKYFG